jgi:hypothetical protein
MIADDKNSVRLIDRVNDAVRENPIAAGLIGVGLFMTFFGNAKLPAFAGKVPGAIKSAAGAVGDTVASSGRSVSDGLSAAGGAVVDAASSLTEKASSAVRDKLSGESMAEQGNRAGEAITRGAEQLRDNAASAARRGMDAGIALQGRLADTLAQQPLLLGAIGLAIGAGMASALPATDTERELVGEQASALRGEVEDRANQVISDVKEAAAAQGFTTSAAKEALQGVARKTQSVAGAARESVGNRFS